VLLICRNYFSVIIVRVCRKKYLHVFCVVLLSALFFITVLSYSVNNNNNNDARGLHGLCCRRSAERRMRHSQLNDIIWRSLCRAKIPASKEPLGLTRNVRLLPQPSALFQQAPQGVRMVFDLSIFATLLPIKKNWFAFGRCLNGTGQSSNEWQLSSFCSFRRKAYSTSEKIRRHPPNRHWLYLAPSSGQMR